jgi:hypothetical protein
VKPARFVESNCTLTGGEGISDLPVYRDDEHAISRWRPSLLDRVRLLFGGSLWLVVKSPSPRTPPPVSLTTAAPFERRRPTPAGAQP